MDRSKIADLLGMPRSTFTGEMRLHLDGNSRLVVEGHLGLREYGPERIRVRGRKQDLLVEGRKLELETIGAEDMVIAGEIGNVAFLTG